MPTVCGFCEFGGDFGPMNAHLLTFTLHGRSRSPRKACIHPTLIVSEYLRLRSRSFPKETIHGRLMLRVLAEFADHVTVNVETQDEKVKWNKRVANPVTSEEWDRAVYELVHKVDKHSLSDNELKERVAAVVDEMRDRWIKECSPSEGEDTDEEAEMLRKYEYKTDINSRLTKHGVNHISVNQQTGPHNVHTSNKAGNTNHRLRTGLLKPITVSDEEEDVDTDDSPRATANVKGNQRNVAEHPANSVPTSNRAQQRNHRTGSVKRRTSVAVNHSPSSELGPTTCKGKDLEVVPAIEPLFYLHVEVYGSTFEIPIEMGQSLIETIDEVLMHDDNPVQLFKIRPRLSDEMGLWTDNRWHKIVEKAWRKTEWKKYVVSCKLVCGR